MSWLNKVFGSSFANPATWVRGWIQGWDQGWDWGDGREEKRLTSEKTLTYAPVWYGVNKIAGHIAQLPVNVFKASERGFDIDKRHSVQRLMKRPNAYQTSIVFRELLAVNSLLDGNGRAAIVRENGRIKELIPLLPHCTASGLVEGEKFHATRPHEDDRLRLFFRDINNTDNRNGLILLRDEDVLHVPGLSINGVTGIPLREIASRNFGASINSEKRLATQMENGFSGNLMLQAPPGVFRNQEDAEEFIEHFEKRHNSPDKAGKPGLLREGVTANILAMNNKDAEMIENRKFQRQDAALYLGLESILGDDNSVSYNSLTEKNMAYLSNTLNKWLRRWEEEMEFKLLPRRQFDSDSHLIRFDTSGLLKSDFKSQVEALTSLVTSTIFSRNDAREMLEMNPVEGGDKYENPAITIKEAPSKETEKPDAPDTPDTEVSDVSRKALDSHIGHLISVESNRVKDAAKNAKTIENFVGWMNHFYDKKWEKNFADNLESLGIDRNEATIYCDESRIRLLGVCDRSTLSNLAKNVEECVSSWKLRSSTIGGSNV